MRPARDPLDIPRFLNRQNNQYLRPRSRLRGDPTLRTAGGRALEARSPAVHRLAAPTDRKRRRRVIAGKVGGLSIGVMNSSMMRGVAPQPGAGGDRDRHGGTTSGAAAQAPPGAVVQPFDSGARLRGYLPPSPTIRRASRR